MCFCVLVKPRQLRCIVKFDGTEINTWRWMGNLTMKKILCRTNRLATELGIDSVDEVIGRGRLKYYGHME